MKRPIPVILASAYLGLHGAYLIFMQMVHHYPSGALGNVATLGGFFIAVAVMVSWKIKGWRWVGFALYLILLLSDFHILRRIPTVSAESLPIISGSIALFVIHVWAAVELARGASTLKYLSDTSPKRTHNSP
jgi:hypothetical protein